MSKHQTTAQRNTGATSEQVRKSTDRELTEDHLRRIHRREHPEHSDSPADATGLRHRSH